MSPFLEGGSRSDGEAIETLDKVGGDFGAALDY